MTISPEMKTSKVVAGGGAFVIMAAALLLIAIHVGLVRPQVAVVPEQSQSHADADKSVTTATSTAPRQTETVEQAVQYWSAHAAYFSRLAEDRYPNALTNRDSMAPDWAAVQNFGVDLGIRFRETRKEDGEHAQAQRVFPTDPKARETLLKVLSLGTILSSLRTLDDTTPVTDHLTVGDLAKQMFQTPALLQAYKQHLAQLERSVFSDEGKAGQVEGLESGEQLISYLQASAARYQAVNARAMVDLHADEQSRRFCDDSSYTDAVIGVTQSYAKAANAEVDALRQEVFDMKVIRMDYRLLAATSKDNADSRRLLTELKELDARLQKAEFRHFH